MAYSPFTTPRNNNTYSPTLVTDSLAQGIVTKLQHLTAPLTAFTTVFGADTYRPKATHQIRFATAGSTPQQDPTSFESGDSTVGAVSVTMHAESIAWHVTAAERNSGLTPEHLAEINSAKFANVIWSRVAALLSTANFVTNSPVLSAAASFGFAEMVSLRSAIKKVQNKTAVLDGDYLAQLTNTPGFFQATPSTSGVTGWQTFGWTGGIYEATDWSAAGTDVRGIACGKGALVVVAGLPVEPVGAPPTLERKVLTVPGVNMQVALHHWYALASRTEWFSLDIMLGTALGDETQGVLLKSA
jgi:hypothetical protein